MQEIISKAIRTPLHLVPSSAEWPILSGVLRGKKWVVGSSRRACWLGIYETHFQRLLAKELTPGAVFYDVGANVGFYSLLASIAVKSGKVYAFEPVPRNLFYLRRHLELNQTSNAEVLEFAVSDSTGISNFDEGPDYGSGHLGSGNLSVKTASIDNLIAQQGLLPPTHIKMDIEGAELNALIGARSCLLRHRPTLYLATHSDQLHRECTELLQGLGFSIKIVAQLPGGRADLVAKPLSPSCV